MAANKEDIKEWLEEGKNKKATHVIILCDTYDYEDYPVFVSSQEQAKNYKPGNMQKVMEVYNLEMDFDQQLSQYRAFNY